jgi:3-deoxy-D-manno-octulosonic-acid transferase
MGIGVIRGAGPNWRGQDHRPIVPLAIASSGYCSLTPTRYTINLPFSRLGMVVGDPIFIPRNAEPEELERWRQRVEGALNNVTRNAYAQAGANMTSAAIST